MKRIDGIYDHNVFLIFQCRDCTCDASINPSALVHAGIPICCLDKSHGEMEYNGVEIIVREDE